MAHHEGTDGRGTAEGGGEGRHAGQVLHLEGGKREAGVRKKLSYSESGTGVGGVGGEGVARGGGGGGGGGTPVLHRIGGGGALPVGGTPGKEQASGLVSVWKIVENPSHTHAHTHACSDKHTHSTCMPHSTFTPHSTCTHASH